MQVASLIGCKARSRKPIKDIPDEVETQVDCHSAIPSTPYPAPAMISITEILPPSSLEWHTPAGCNLHINSELTTCKLMIGSTQKGVIHHPGTKKLYGDMI